MANLRSVYFLFIILAILVFASSAFSDHHEKGDPEFQRCQSQCYQQHQHDPSRLKECERRCERQCEERHREREREKGHGGHGEHEGADRHWEREREKGHGGHGGREEAEMDPIGLRDPEEVCKRDCPRHKGMRRECERRCEDKYRGKKHWEGDERGWHEEEEVVVRRDERRENIKEEEEEEESRKEQGGRIPFTFEQHRLKEKVRTEDGRVRVAPRFGRQSELLRGIDNYRIAILEANPNSFVAPNHWDAEAVLFVGKGRGVISFLRHDKEMVNIERGDLIRVPSGTTFFMVNKDKNEKLCIAVFFKTISIPGEYRAFFAAGGENPESIFKSLSNEVLEAAFNTPSHKLNRIFSRQNRGPIFRISPEQVRAMTKHASSSEGGGHWPFRRGDESIKTHNLFRNRPCHSNRHGELFQAGEDEYDQLRDLDIGVTFVNISSGSMQAPYYNSRATGIGLVVGGSGYFEMACPHLAGAKGSQRGKRGEEEQEEERSQRRKEGKGQEREEEREQAGPEGYRAVRSRLSKGTIFIVPAGHPVVTVASGAHNLQIVCFKVNFRNNEQFFLAGKNSILRKMDREEMEVSFNTPASEVKEILDAATDSYFMKGPEQLHEGGGGHGRRRHGAMDSILDFAAGLY